jgi:putative spermidine/putrescine transport system permease protein
MRREHGGAVLSWLLAAALFLFLIGPIVTVVVWAFAERWRYPNLIPTVWGLRHWQAMLSRRDVAEAMTASVTISAAATCIAAALCWPAAYAMARVAFPGRRIVLLAFLAVQAFPRFPLYVAIAAFFLRLGLVGTFWGVVIVQMIGALLYLVWIPTAAFRAIRPELEEAAFDLGASRLRVFFEITLPQAAPALTASFVLAFTNIFFETEGALLIGSPEIKTVPVLMLQLASDVVVQNAAVLCVMLWVPTLCLLVLSRRFMGSRTVAAGLGA